MKNTFKRRAFQLIRFPITRELLLETFPFKFHSEFCLNTLTSARVRITSVTRFLSVTLPECILSVCVCLSFASVNYMCLCNFLLTKSYAKYGSFPSNEVCTFTNLGWTIKSWRWRQKQNFISKLKNRFLEDFVGKI